MAKHTELFIPIASPERLNPHYEYMRTSPYAESARIMAAEVWEDFHDKAGNFVEQFQTTGFDSRTFELYLYAYLSRSGFQISQEYDRPDFIIERNGLKVAIEATTINPPQQTVAIKQASLVELSQEELQVKIDNELPVRFGSPLFSKLQKRYWELEHCRTLPIVFAIQAFHEEGSLYFSDSSLSQYLYGLKHLVDWDQKGDLIVRAKELESHVWGSKVIPSCFFKQPLTQHISAVLFSNSGTFAKFNRMGYQAGYHRGNIRIIRHGTCYHHDPNATKPIRFQYDLDHPLVVETWGQGLNVFHNPYALMPVPRGYFKDAADSYLEDGQVKTDMPGFHPYMSQTIALSTEDLISFPIKSEGMPIECLLKSEFDGYGPARSHGAVLIAQEKEWYITNNKNLIASLLLDYSDQDWAYVILGRDQKGVFRWISGEHSIADRDEARQRLFSRILKINESGTREFPQD